MIKKWIPVIGVFALATTAFAKPVAKKARKATAATTVSTGDYAGSGDVSAFPSAETIYDATNNTNWELQGVDFGVDGQLLTVYASDGYDMTVVHKSTNAAAGDKIFTPTGSDLVTDKEGSVTMFYDTSADSGNGAWMVASWVD